MIWLIPRFDPGALTEFRRPHSGGVSTEGGAPLPHGPYPRLVMLWMYAECAHAVDIPPEQRDPIASISDFLLALDIETREVSPVFAQTERLFACRFHVGDKVIPVIEPLVRQMELRAGNRRTHRTGAERTTTRVQPANGLGTDRVPECAVRTSARADAR